MLQTGYGASGLPHIGTFNEVARTTMVRNAFRALTEDAIPTRLISFSDDMDGLRKVPENVPNREAVAEDLGKPLTAVRDPFGEHESFGAHNNARMRAFLDGHGFDYEFLSSTECYRSGRFDPTLLQGARAVRQDPGGDAADLGRGAARHLFALPADQPDHRPGAAGPDPRARSGRGTIVFEDEDGARREVPVTGGAVKLQWKPDWACRWAALGVDYEMAGKDLIELGQASVADLHHPRRRRRPRASISSCSSTRTTRRSPSPRATA